MTTIELNVLTKADLQHSSIHVTTEADFPLGPKIWDSKRAVAFVDSKREAKPGLGILYIVLPSLDSEHVDAAIRKIESLDDSSKWRIVYERSSKVDHPITSS